MEKTSSSCCALSIGSIILLFLENRSNGLVSLMGIISFCASLIWIRIIPFYDFFSCLWFLLKTILHFLFSTWKRKNTSTTPLEPWAAHENEDFDKKLCRGEVEVVMEKLGLFYDPSGDELRERLGSNEIAALFDEEEELSLEEVNEAFGVFDENSDGFIDASELERVLCKMGFAQVSETECQKMIAGFDDNGDGRIDSSEFVKLLENCAW